MSDDIKYTIIEVKHEDIPDEVRAILDSDDDSDICSCGHEWSRDVTSTPIPDDEVPDYLKRLGEWDTSKVTDMNNMFADAKSVNDMPNLHVEDVIDCSLVLIKHGNKFLGVSRKHDHNDIGLPGGKREQGESFEDCARREATEETDFIITLFQDEPFKGMDMGLYCQTYLAEITGKVSQARDPSETGIVDWFDKQAFIDGTFGEYNTKMFKHFGL